MNKSVIAIIILFCTTALANDMTVMRHLNPKQSKTISFEIPKGHSIINVTTDAPSAFFDCLLSKEDGQSFSKVNTNTCDFVMNFDYPVNVTLRLKNGTVKPMDCKAVLHTLSK